MDASPLPVVVRWTDATESADDHAPNVPEGFTRVDGVAASAETALQRAAAAWPGRDVLVLHAGVRLHGDAWRRLAAAWRDGDWDALSPRLAPAADAADADAAAWTRADHVAFPADAASPHCALWRGDWLASRQAPARAGVLPCVVVGIDAEAGAPHPPAAATGAGEPPPVGGDTRDGRAAVPREDVVLHVLHGWGGGAERFVRDLSAHDAGRTHLVLVAHSRADAAPFGERLALYHDLDAPPLREWLLSAPIEDTAPASMDVQAILADLLPEWGVGAVLVSSLIGHSLDVLRTGLPTAVCFHDAYPLWPLLHDERDPRSAPFDLAALAEGLAAGGGAPFASRDAAHWRALRDATLAALEDAGALLVAPSVFARDRLCAIEPELREHRWQVIPHGHAPFAPGEPDAATPAEEKSAPAAAADAQAAGAPLRVLVPGRVHGGKGERLLDALLPQLPPGVELVLLGCGRAGTRFADTRVTVIPDYRRDELPAQVAALAPDVALLPSTVPETFGYTLSEMLALGVPVLVAAPGAPAERLAAHGGGLVLPSDAAAVAATLAGLAADRGALSALRDTWPTLPDAEAMADTWRLALSVAPVPLRLPPADASSLRLRAMRRTLRDLRAELAVREVTLAGALRDLDGRAEWANDLQGQIDRGRRRNDELQAELDRRTDWARGLERDLADARGRLSALDAELERRAAWGRDLQAELDAARARQRQADAELDRRARWAHDLQQQVDDAVASLAGLRERHDATLAELAAAREAARLEAQAVERERLLARRLQADAEERELEIRRLEEYLGELDHQLAEAHGYYQRDSTDLARQRDVAIGQRDQAAGELERIKRSLFWRATAIPRAIVGAVRDKFAAGLYRERHLRQLVSRGINSLRMRGFAGTLRRVRDRYAHPPGEDAALQPPASAGAGERALRLRQAREPMASVVVPVFNQLPLSLACLRALADCGDRAPFEVIVVDDGSSDATPRVLPSIPGVRFHRNASNLGFVGACNAGAELARGRYLVFLNNDTTVQPGWLDALLKTFDTYPDTGLAGSKLVYPDGRLQEAGGIVFADGSGWNYGRFEDPSHPHYAFVREVDYCSGAAIAVPRELFLRLGGFDTLYAPAYYEDTDLAMRVRAAGLKVRYQPASTVVHHEGATSGTDVREGVKAYQVANHAKFRERWADVLSRQHVPPGTPPAVAADRDRGVRDGRRVLVLDACTPTPDRDSGSVRMLALLRLLRAEGCSVVFFAENRAYDGAYSAALQQAGVEVWWHPHLADVPRWVEKHGREFDLVIASRHYVLAPILPLLRRHAPRAHLVFDTVDLHHVREQREAELADDPSLWRTAARTRRAELALIRAADTTWVVSAAEKALLAKEVPDARVQVVSNIHDVHGHGPDWGERAGLLFVGSYRHPPNVDAARWMATEILPLVRARRPDIELHLVGGDAPGEVESLGALEGVRFHGYVPDLLPLLQSCRVGVAPLRYGAGVKGKVNQALAHGLPMVATGCAVEGMHLHDGGDVLVADDAAAFADAVIRLYEDPALWLRLADGGLENTRRHFSTAGASATLRALLDSLPGVQ